MDDQRIRLPARTLLDCASTDQLCIVRTQEYEVIVVPVFLIGVSVILLAIILWLRYRPRKPDEDDQRQDEQRKPSAGYINHAISLEELTLDQVLRTKDPSLQALEIPRARIRQPLQLAGEGRFGPIYRTKLNGPEDGKEKDVIIKRLRNSCGAQEIRDFLQRVAFQGWLGQHPNIVELLGCCPNEKPFCMVLENIEPGSLLHFLWDCRRDVMSMDGILYDLTECQVYTIALQVLSALVSVYTGSLFPLPHPIGNYYVHMEQTLWNQLTPVLCIPYLQPASLSLAKVEVQKLPILWSHEVCSEFLFYISGAPPYPEIPPNDILQHLQRGNIMKRPPTCKPAMYNVMKICWLWKAPERPSLPELRKRLESAKKASNDKTVLQVPEQVVPELYAGVAGTEFMRIENDYTVL
uniref:Serine/threonine/tyrosine kinase 1 n=1 Tax=Xenopus tropicalis TaxID=8364 RepID=A0A6I8QP81_XENTR